MHRLRLIPVVIYIVLIFVVSSIPSLKPPGPKGLYSDKVAHFLEYLVLGVLLFRGIGWEASRSRWATFAFLFAVGVSVGALDEIYQSYIPGREMDLHDWYADGAGVALGVGLFAFTPLGSRLSARARPGARRHTEQNRT